MISRRHCRLEVQPPTMRIRDLGSKNGTFVNGMDIGRRFTDAPPDDCQAAAGEAVALRNGDLITLGELLLQVELDASDASRRHRLTSAEPEHGDGASQRNREPHMA